ncbi:heme-dependent oxidative N-demethylase subunit alpha family protein [Histidinibacterium lentulum]|uniref:DUF3445 domain-containing protein n=1 Tax=Histidinibacterium lentulum TaxID=2480588 RepID=A0A3N2R4R3_9RHOB|nr:heme-dependent oxidative N-demethylase subunit alpha family protein [Histidinibacterium lentulum]ROU02373.1 DUF3445 domain-containing protein [Histidinibacterium lentulum]
MEILQSHMPEELIAAAARPLPKMAPVEGPWVTVDDAWAAQVAERRRLMAERPEQVLAVEPGAEEALAALLEAARAGLAAHPVFAVEGDAVTCPDGRQVVLDPARVLESLGAIMAEDLCVLERRGEEHVLIAAGLCFPAGWTLAEKIGRPLMRIHRPVPPYDTEVGRRVQRLFDAVRSERPIWRANLHGYDRADLFLPRREEEPKHKLRQAPRFLRAERQTVLRLTAQAVLFAIHTTVVRA